MLMRNKNTKQLISAEESGATFNTELFKDKMTRGGDASEFLCQFILSWRGYSASSLKVLKKFSLAGVGYKLDKTSRHQIYSMMQMDIHDPIFQELENIAREHLVV